MSTFERPRRVSEVEYETAPVRGNTGAVRKDVNGEDRDHDSTNDFLSQFDPAFKSAAAQLFHDAAKRGASTPGSVVESVRRDALTRAMTHPRRADYKALADALQVDSDAAMRFAQHAIEWGRMTPEERSRAKAQRGEAHKRQYLDTQPMTGPQEAYLAALGAWELSYPVPKSKLEASELISRILRERGKA